MNGVPSPGGAAGCSPGPSFLGRGHFAQLRQDIRLAAINEAKPGLNLAIILTVLGTIASGVSGYCKGPGCN